MKVLIDVDGWGAVMVSLRKGRSKPMVVQSFYSTMPSRQHLPNAQRWVRRFLTLTGLEAEVEVREATDTKRLP